MDMLSLVSVSAAIVVFVRSFGGVDDGNTGLWVVLDEVEDSLSLCSVALIRHLWKFVSSSDDAVEEFGRNAHGWMDETSERKKICVL